MANLRQKKRHGGCKFTPELGEKICAGLAAGQSILAIARIEGMPPESTIRRWGRNPKWSSEEFVAEFARAREDNAHHHFDRMQEIEARLEQEDIDPHAARVLLDSMKWRLAKQLPRSFGDRSELQLTGKLAIFPPIEHAPDWIKQRLGTAAAAATSSVQVPSEPECPTGAGQGQESETVH